MVTTAWVYRIQVRDRHYIGITRNLERRLDEHTAGLRDPTTNKLLYVYARKTNLSEIRKHTTVLFEGVSVLDSCLLEITLIGESPKHKLLNVSPGGETPHPLTPDEQDIVDEAVLDYSPHGRFNGAYARLWRQQQKRRQSK